MPVALPDQAFWRIKTLLIERTGHFYYNDKDGVLWDKLRRRLHQTGTHDCAAYLKLLSAPDTGPAEWAALESIVTIGETFFFRYAEQFTALRETILPALIEKNRETRRIRIWSAGCATGAEAYSVAMLLRQLMGDTIDTWQISILGTDISEAFLTTARQARFGAWALRALTKEEIERDFLPAADRQTWLLRPLHHSMVRFERQNLLALLGSDAPLRMTDFDLILCRNVLIYFHWDVVVQIVNALSRRLVDNGWLLLGHAEPNAAFEHRLTAVNLPGTVAYQPKAAGQATPVSPVRPEPPLQADFPPLKSLRPSPPRPSMKRPMQRVAVPVDAGDLYQDLRTRANTGDLAGAEIACGSALVSDPVNPTPHYYLGLVAQALNRPEEAEAAFHHAIYLYNHFAMAHYHLGLLLIAQGRLVAGRRSLSNAARICAALPDDTVLQEGDGMTAESLRELTRTQLARHSHVQD